MSGVIWGCHSLGREYSLHVVHGDYMQGVKESVIKHPKMPRTPPTTKSYSAQSIHSTQTKMENSCGTVILSFSFRFACFVFTPNAGLLIINSCVDNDMIHCMSESHIKLF